MATGVGLGLVAGFTNNDRPPDGYSFVHVAVSISILAAVVALTLTTAFDRRGKRGAEF